MFNVRMEHVSMNIVFMIELCLCHFRNLSQTEWIVDGAKKTETCLEELIKNPINRYVKAEQLRFSSSGREDVDVLMLGNGRFMD